MSMEPESSKRIAARLIYVRDLQENPIGAVMPLILSTRSKSTSGSSSHQQG
jgi:hypothetical protein